MRCSNQCVFSSTSSFSPCRKLFSTHLVTLTPGDTSFLLGVVKSFRSPSPIIASRLLPESQAAAYAVLAIFP